MNADPKDTARAAFNKGDKDRAKAKVDQLVGQAVEVPVDDDQKAMEAVILTALVLTANSDTSDLKYDLLNLKGSDFASVDHRTIFTAIKALDIKGEHVDQVTVGQLLGGQYQDVVTAIFGGTMPAVSQVQTYRTRIINRADVRQLYVIGQGFMKAIEDGDVDDRAGMVAGLQQAVFDFNATKRLVPDVQTEADALDSAVMELSDNPRGYPTGFCHLDEVIGGLKPGLFVIAGPPSAGKTTLVKQLADQVAESADGPPVLFFTYEQSALDIRVKTLARLSNVSNELIKRGEAGTLLNDAVVRYKRFGQRMKIIEGDRHHTTGTILLMAQRERQRTGKSPVIVVDYLQTMPVNDPDLPDRRAQVDFIVTELRRIARDTGAAIIAVSSMSRESYNKIKASVFKESGGIEYGADVAGVLRVEEEGPDGTWRSIQLAIVKNRHGRRGTVGLSYTMNVDRFESTGSGFTSYVDDMEARGPRRDRQ